MTFLRKWFNIPVSSLSLVVRENFNLIPVSVSVHASPSPSPSVIYVRPSPQELFSERVIYVESKLDCLLFKADGLIIVKNHTFEEKFNLTESGPRYYMQEILSFDVFNRIEGRIVHTNEIKIYNGLSRVNFKLVLNTKDINFNYSYKPGKALIALKLNMFYSDFDYSSKDGFESLLAELKRVQVTLSSLNLSKGYITDTFILGDNYPIINEIAGDLIKVSEWYKLDCYAKVKVFKSVCNLIMCNCFSLTIKGLKSLEEIVQEGLTLEQKLWIEDAKSKLRVYKSWSYSLLDNSVKQHFMRKKGLVLGEVYTGFDTEYVPYDWGHNELVSAQVSSCTNIKIRIPLRSKYQFEGVNTTTGETYEIAAPRFSNEVKYEQTIEEIILSTREILFPGHDAGLANVCNYLIAKRKVYGIENIICDKKGYVFMFDVSEIKNTLILPAAGEKLKLSFDSLNRIINDPIISNLELKKVLLSKIIKDVSRNSQKELLGFEESLPWTNEIIKNSATEEYILSNKENAEKKQKYKVFNTGTDLFSFKTRTYLCAHYNAADLGMIENWAEVSLRDVDILKKSYTSLTSPLKSLGLEVHIRDTILLSSAAASSLEAVGKAYNLNKIKIPVKYYPMMDKLLEDNRDLYKAYAMQDSLITLVHSLFMSLFVFKLGELKMPCTLGSISTKYLKQRWTADHYRGYQVDFEHLLGTTDNHTPIGINNLGLIGESLNQFIGTFRGGRNECFKYGIDTKTRWYDYDLTSCYSTIMSMCGDPNYETVKEIDVEAEILEESLLYSDRQALDSERKEILERFVQEKKSSAFNINPNLVVYAAEKNSSEEEEEIKFSSEELKEIKDIEEQTTEASELAALTPTVASLIKDPDYSNAVTISPGNWKDVFEKYDFVQSYAALKVKFMFPDSLKFPPIPVHLKMQNSNQTIYPLTGESLITGLEFLAACNILKRCDGFGYIKVLSGTYIPFKQEVWNKELEDNIPSYKPFAAVIKDLQANRAKWKKLTGKKSAMERIYKDLGNMLYGKIVSGISNKASYDSRLLAMKKLSSGDLTNPIIGAWITGFVRALLAELLQIVDKLGGQVCSITTDGFVSDIPDLEAKVLNYMKENNIKNSLLHLYINSRISLSGDPKAEALEVKTSVRGLIQWTTRGQLSVNHTDKDLNNYKIPIAAMTGFQRRGFEQEEVVKLVTDSLKDNNQILFMQTRLTGALEDYKNKADVSMLASLRKFRTVFDSRREIIESENSLLDTAPYYSIDDAYINRSILDHFRQSIYSASYSKLYVKNITARNALDDLIKFIMRLFAHKYNYDVPLDKKYEFIRKLKLLLPSKKIDNTVYLLDSLNTIIQNPGVIVNKLPVYRITQNFVDNIFENDLQLAISLNLKEKLSNFIIPTIITALVPFTPIKPLALLEKEIETFANPACFYAFSIQSILNRIPSNLKYEVFSKIRF